MNNLLCPQCGFSHIKRNGHTHYGEQNYLCKNCGRQFVQDSQHISEEKKALIKRLLLERLSLRGICRATEVSLTWLLGFIAEVYADTPQLTKNELARMAHLLLSAAMIARLITHNKAIALPPSLEVAGLRLDETSGGAFVEGSYVRLTERGFKLLRFLHSRANQTCTRREIAEQVFGYSFDEKDESQEALINTAISRLRAEVEPDPQHPRFIRNERGRGYRLVTEPSALPER